MLLHDCLLSNGLVCVAKRGETVCSLALGLAVSLMAAFPKLFLRASHTRDPDDSKEAAGALP